MMRMRIPNGILTSGQMRVLAEMCNATVKEQDFKIHNKLTSPPGKTSNCGGSGEDISDIITVCKPV